MATFTSWADELARFKNALADKNVDAFFLQGTENRNEMRVMYTKLENVAKFIEWLEMKAANEALSADDGAGVLFSVGGA